MKDDYRARTIQEAQTCRKITEAAIADNLRLLEDTFGLEIVGVEIERSVVSYKRLGVKAKGAIVGIDIIVKL